MQAIKCALDRPIVTDTLVFVYCTEKLLEIEELQKDLQANSILRSDDQKETESAELFCDFNMRSNNRGCNNTGNIDASGNVISDEGVNNSGMFASQIHRIIV